MICFVAAPTIPEFEGTIKTRDQGACLTPPTAPLGILSLAAILEEKQFPVRLVDLNRLFLDWLSKDGSAPEGPFFPSAVDELVGVHADVYGFGSISSTYPLTVRLAREVRRAHPRALILFGGPQASSVDVDTLEAFPFVDAVVRGEAEESLPQLLAGGLEGVPGVTFRSAGRVVRSPDPQSLPDPDRLPMPAYHLWPEIEKSPFIPLEAGRGCPFACTFCSTSRFFRRRYRLKSPGRMIEQMKHLQGVYGVTTFRLVHDTFTAVRAQAVEFCEALLECGAGYKWSCSSRTDCVDEELLDLMARAGCQGIFFGVETASPRMQHVIAKDLDLDHTAAVLRRADTLKIRTTVSLIAGFPDETPDDLRGSVEFILDSMRLDRVEPQFHLLAPLAGTAIQREFQNRLQWDGIFSDIAFQGWRQDPEDCTLIRQYPRIFANFYAVPTTHLDRARLAELRNFLIYGMACYRWLLVALHRHSGILAVFDRWRAWRATHRPAVHPDGPYHASDGFRTDFLDFVASEYAAADDPELVAVTTLLEYQTQARRPPPPVAESPAAPQLAPGVRLLYLGVDYNRVIGALRNNLPLRDVPRRPVVLAERQLPGDRVETLQLSQLSAALVQLCDGTRTIPDIVVLFPTLAKGLDTFPPGAACRFALDELREQGLLAEAA
jgi:radical SAM superfamily enzyme YgiQ (UPF0313 family)